MGEKVLQAAKINIEECDEDFSVSENIDVLYSFKSMGLKPELLRGIYQYGFERPSHVQQRSIGQIILGRDVVVQAQSGTGKTATFCIGTLQRIDEKNKETQALFLAPTRELASQTHQVATALADYLSVRCVLCCGGRSNIGETAKALECGSQIVVGTPGRILDMLRQGCLKINRLRVFVIDEADEMLNQGLRDQLEQICKRLPSISLASSVLIDNDIFGNLTERVPLQRIVVSATWTSGCREVMQQFLNNPVRILVPRDELSLSGIKQFYIDVGGEEWKFETLADIFASVCVPQTVVFVNTRHKVEWLSGRLRQDGFAVTAAHGEMDQSMRETVMKHFRAGKSRILVTTDVWARGIDVHSVGLVVNYDLPLTAAVYLHRIGRSGRFGRRGIAISLVRSRPDCTQLGSIAKAFSIVIEAAPSQLGELTSRCSEAVAQPSPDVVPAVIEQRSSPEQVSSAKLISSLSSVTTKKLSKADAIPSAARRRKLKIKRNQKRRLKRNKIKK